MNTKGISRRNSEDWKVTSTNSNPLARRRLEVSRRMAVLRHKREDLERELRSINNALKSLATQLEKDSAYEKLFL